MSTNRQNSLGYCAKSALLAAIAAVAIAIPADPARAQGFFDSFFSRREAPSAPAYSNPFGDFFNPFSARPEPPRQPMGGSVAFCVRACDGRYFPIQRVAGASPAQQCSAFCPAAQTKIYNGSGIDHAVGADGKKYSELSTAFVYRERVIPGCTCNGKDAFGLVTTPVAEDPTLRAGDIVATNNGLMAYAGNGGRNNTAQFTPIDTQRLSAELRQKLAETKVEPAAPAPAQVKPVDSNAADADPPARNSRNRRVQAPR